VYEVIVRKFLAVFYPPAVYQKVSLTSAVGKEHFFSSFKVLVDEGYLKVMQYSFGRKQEAASGKNSRNAAADGQETGEEAAEYGKDSGEEGQDTACDQSFLDALAKVRKGSVLPIEDFRIKEGETSPPKRYTSGSMILAMENAGQLIEDEELRAQIKGSGIGTSATRAEILKKLIHIKYLALNKKTQIITPTLQGEMVYDVVDNSIKSLLNPELTASWEKGLTYVAEGSITPDEYMKKLDDFITRRTVGVKGLNNEYQLRACYDKAAGFY